MVSEHSNYFDENGFFVVPQASLPLKSIFSDRTKCTTACSAVVFDEFISHRKLFYRGHKTSNFFNAIFHKKDFWKKEKRFCRDISIQ